MNMITIEEYVDRLGIPVEEIKSNSRKAELACARQTYIWYLKSNGRTYRESAGFFGKDRSTAYHAVKKTKNMMAYNKCYVERFIKPLINE